MPKKPRSRGNPRVSYAAKTGHQLDGRDEAGVDSVRPVVSLLLQAAIVMAAVGYVIWQNTFFSADWWLVPLRDIDDMALNASTERMREAIIDGRWGRVASFFDHAYGAGYYLLMVFVTLPAYLLDSPQTQIIVGRSSSLAAVFLTSLVVAQIGRRLFPKSKHLWLVALGLGFITPTALIYSTKMHVNGWSALLGVLAVYVLIHENRLSRKFLYAAAISMGAAIGFKLTAISILPIFVVVLLIRVASLRLRHLFGSIVVLGFSALLVAAPIVFGYPIYPQGAMGVFDFFLIFAELGTEDTGDPLTRLIGGLSFYGHFLVLIAVLVMMAYLVFRPKGLSRYSLQRMVPLIIAINILAVWTLGSFLLSKPDVYLAAYAIHATVFLPIGIFALAKLNIGRYRQVLLAWSLVFLNLFLSPQFAGSVIGSQNYALRSSSQNVERKLEAARDIVLIVGEISPGTRVLVDSHSIFPYSHIRTETQITMNYGNLTNTLDLEPGNPDFTYIVLDTNSYHGQPNSTEESVRNNLRVEGVFGSSRYDRIYSENGTELYVLKPIKSQ